MKRERGRQSLGMTMEEIVVFLPIAFIPSPVKEGKFREGKKTEEMDEQSRAKETTVIKTV